MATNLKLNKAIQAKNDEFYTQKRDIEAEIQAYLDFNPSIFEGKIVLCPCDNPTTSNFTAYFVDNFEKLKLKALISTCFSSEGRGKMLHKTQQAHKIYNLHGNGDFRSDELLKLRDESDFIITNPPFSLFRDFMAWIMESDKRFAVICNKNCVTFKEIFPKIQANEIWSGFRSWAGGMWFETIDENNVDKVENGVNLKNVSAIWLTNIEHNRRYEPITLLNRQKNLLKYPKLKDKNAYIPYDNYNAIEIPVTKVIPSDYDGVMGVPISFLDKFNPCQFTIMGMDSDVKNGNLRELASLHWKGKLDRAYLNGKRMYSRLLIQRK